MVVGSGLRAKIERRRTSRTCRTTPGLCAGYSSLLLRLELFVHQPGLVRLKRFDLLKINDEEKLNVPLKPGETNIQYYVSNDELSCVLYETHIRTGHREKNSQMKYSAPKKGIVVKPMISPELNSICQGDLIDLQSNRDVEYKFIMVYEDHLTKFDQLRPLKTKRAEDVVYHAHSIFLTFGDPAIFESNNGREFSNKSHIRNMHYVERC
ncbi:KRAB-A domain-containing protein 2 [Trichonephila clavipes]|nr:KRAB-A domain-containing protein 2 [Trichonephila clavipes]